MASFLTKTFGKGTVATGVDVGDGNGSTTTFTGTISPTTTGLVVPGTLAISATISAQTRTAQDQGDGTLTGTQVTSGTINYATGEWSVTFAAAPTNSTNILASYTTVPNNPVQVTGGSTTITENATFGSKTRFQGFLPHKNIIPGSVTFTTTVSSSGRTSADDGKGALTPGTYYSSGTINYDDGSFTIYYPTAPDNTTVTCTYKHNNNTTQEEVVITLFEDINILSIGGADNKAASGTIWSSLDGLTWTYVNSFKTVAGGKPHVQTVQDNKTYKVVSANVMLDINTAKV